jgi:hypothetical protein
MATAAAIKQITITPVFTIRSESFGLLSPGS